MTINGGQPHRVGYGGQPYKVTVFDAEQDRRRIVCWVTIHPDTSSENAALLKSLELRPSWSEARCERVTNKETGE